MKYPLAINTWDHKEIEAIQSVIDSGRFTMGPKVEQFENEFTKIFGVKHAIMVNSGSSANLLMIAALILDDDRDFKKGDEVIVPAVSWSTTYFPLTQYGLKTIFVDIDKNTLNIDPNKVKEAITPKTKAILAVNLLGNSCDYKELLQLCKEHNLLLLEDNCESLGAKYQNQFLGTIGEIGTFSFFFSHHIQTMEGGMIVTNNDRTAQYLRSLRAHGWIRDLPNENFLYNKSGNAFSDSFKFILPGYCVRPLEMSGAVGSVQLSKMTEMIKKRRENAKVFSQEFSKLPNLIIQKEIGESSWFGFSIICNDKFVGKRQELLNVLANEGVETRPIVAGNFVNHPVIKFIDHEIRGDLHNAEYIDKNGFFIGNDSKDLTKQIKNVANILKEIL